MVWCLFVLIARLTFVVYCYLCFGLGFGVVTVDLAVVCCMAILVRGLVLRFAGV